jgi:hypothetical protein
VIIIKKKKDTLEALLEQIKLYRDLLDLLKEKQQLLEAEEDITAIEEKERELRDEIREIDQDYNLKQTDKLRLISKNDIEELNEFKPLLKELYDVEQKTKELAVSS